jgi:hypothetical protein
LQHIRVRLHPVTSLIRRTWIQPPASSHPSKTSA